MSFYYVFPTVGAVYGTRSFIVVTMGGLGSVIGAFVSGIVLGLMETVGAVVVVSLGYHRVPGIYIDSGSEA